MLSCMLRAAVATILDCYPAVFLACHCRHIKDPHTRRVLSSRQAEVLDHLDAVEPTHLRQLASHLGITPSSMSLMIDRLERAGYARRSRDTGDERRINLRLTIAGMRIKQQQKVLAPELVEAMVRRLAPAELKAAMAGLRSLARAAREMSASNEIKNLPRKTAS
jgi:DNA-binding MarR family transcriptional regulator